MYYVVEVSPSGSRQSPQLKSPLYHHHFDFSPSSAAGHLHVCNRPLASEWALSLRGSKRVFWHFYNQRCLSIISYAVNSIEHERVGCLCIKLDFSGKSPIRNEWGLGGGFLTWKVIRIPYIGFRVSGQFLSLSF